MKNPQYPQGIRIEYYKDCLEEIPADPKTKNKRYGALSPLTTKDQLLFLIGKKYNPLYLQVKDLFSETMRLLPLPDSSMKQPNGLFEIAGKQVEVRVAYHQLDDFMVLLTAHETKKLAWHYLIFEEFLTEGGSWSNIPEVQKENKEIPEISSRDQETISLSLGALRKAKDRLFAQNLMALKAIQDFEKATIEAFKATLTSDPLPTDQSDWISFSQVLQLAGITDSEAIYTLNHKIRTVVLHARIPDEWTFNGPMFQESIFGPSYRDMEAVKGEKRARYARFSPDIKAFGNK